MKISDSSEVTGFVALLFHKCPLQPPEYTIRLDVRFRISPKAIAL